MTDSIKGLSGTNGVSSGGSQSGDAFSKDHKKKRYIAPQSDLVEISKDARERSTGKRKKSVLEYLKELFG